MRQPGRKLSERSQPFRAARLRLHALELAIGFRQLLRQLLISRGLPAIFESKTIYNHRREKKEQNPNRKFSRASGSQLVLLQGWIEKGTIRG